MDTINQELKLRSFLKKLNRLSKSTGIVITEFGDEYYNPRLTGESIDDAEDSASWLFISYNTEIQEYEIRMGNQYDGKLLRKNGFIVEEEKEVDYFG